MINILYITASTRGDASFSNKVAKRVIHELTERHPGAKLTTRDLARDPLPHIDDDFIVAINQPQTERQRTLLAKSDALVDELLASDVVVIASPMINFGVPSTLKTWIDYIARAGRTFSYTEQGPKGLLTGKRAILVHSRGGVYSNGPMQVLDHQASYLKNLLAFIGIADVHSIAVEGTSYGPDAAEKAVAAGIAQAQEVAIQLASARG